MDDGFQYTREAADISLMNFTFVQQKGPGENFKQLNKICQHRHCLHVSILILAFSLAASMVVDCKAVLFSMTNLNQS